MKDEKAVSFLTSSATRLVILLLLLTIAGCGKTNVVSTPQRSEAAKRIEAVLPHDWELTESDGQILISRRQPVMFYGCVGLDVYLLGHPDLWRKHIEENGSSNKYTIRLRLAPQMNLEEYSRVRESNDQIRVTKSTIIPGREFYEDDAMSSFDPSYRELPRYYDEHSSIYQETTLHPWECIYPDEVAIECENVLRSLESIFKPYSRDDGRQTLSIRMNIEPLPSVR